MTQQDELIARITQDLRARETEVAKLRASNERLATTLGHERVEREALRGDILGLEHELARIDGLRDLNARSSRAWKRLAKRLRGQVPDYGAERLRALAEQTKADTGADLGASGVVMGPAHERKPPFPWTDADKAKLVPGATVLCSAGERCVYLSDDVHAYGYLRLHDMEHDIRFSEAREDVDPTTIDPPTAGFDANGSDAT